MIDPIPERVSMQERHWPRVLPVPCFRPANTSGLVSTPSNGITLDNLTTFITLDDLVTYVVQG